MLLCMIHSNLIMGHLANSLLKFPLKSPPLENRSSHEIEAGGFGSMMALGGSSGALPRVPSTDFVRSLWPGQNGGLAGGSLLNIQKVRFQEKFDSKLDDNFWLAGCVDGRFVPFCFHCRDKIYGQGFLKYFLSLTKPKFYICKKKKKKKKSISTSPFPPRARPSPWRRTRTRSFPRPARSPSLR